MRRIYSVVFTLLLCLAVGCSTSPTGRSQFLIVSPESAIQQSRSAYRQAVQAFRNKDEISHDKLLESRVRRVTGRVVTAAVERFPKSANWDWSVVIIDDADTVNAWCMAGGKMAVYTGLFESLTLTDAEFAQIMGHEISHALADHTAERMSRAMAIQLGRVALSAATLAGYDPEAAVTLWQKMSSLGDDRPPEFLSTHPSPNDRQARLNQMIPAMRDLNPTGKKLSATAITIVD